ncbi:Guanine nucleotide exchange factor lte1 [Mortierella sp. AD011]|nr:Guanine nucleotide exchange factor lte1 [Mortierella sp. AD010]KAF9402526.1 Guanine nucleotide exchange factor lte1 [Mortierella sp. AD011]
MDEQGYHWDSPATPQDNLSSIPATMSNHAPSIFDDIQSDDNESYIIWSSSTISSLKKPTSAPPTTATSTLQHQTIPRLANSTPAHSPSSASAVATATTSTQHPLSLSPATSNEVLPPSISQGGLAIKRWSAKETFKGKDKGKGVPDHDPATRQHSQDILNSRFAGAVRSMDAATSTEQAKLSKSVSKSEPTAEAVAAGGSTKKVTDDPDRVIMAATVEKLVEKLTSEIDYTFLTDFFLIYRLFITPTALLNLFILRFNWALIDDSPQRQIVRIRTFVALRHWILNYFGYDFMRSKELRQKLNIHLRSLSKHPLVVESQRDQRIIRELRRYAQSLKKIYYRNIAQQKLERQARKLGERQARRLQARRGSSLGCRESSVEWSGIPVSESDSQHPLPSRRPSTAAQETLDRVSNVSESLTEELTVEFRSSEQSEEDDSEMGDSMEIEDNFEPSSENSLYDSEEDSNYSTPEDRDPEREYTTDDDELCEDGQRTDSESESLASSQEDNSHGRIRIRDAAFTKECRPPSPPFSPRSQKFQQERSASLRSQQPSHSIASSMASRARNRGKRPPLPDFEGAESNSAAGLDPPSPSFFHSMRANRRSRTKTKSRPLSIVMPVLSPHTQTGPPLSNRGSIRSIEPYINPPPRSIQSIEKKKTWSKYMSATVGRLSKMKKVFSSSSRKDHRHSLPSSSIHSGTNASKRTASGTNHSPRYWQGNRSDPEGDKLSHYLLGSCTGMNMLISSSEDRHLSTDRRFTSERDHQREEVRSDWSSDDDYSQYEMTRMSSRQVPSQDELALEEPEAMDPQLLDARLEQAQYPPYVELSSEHIEISQPTACHGNELPNARDDTIFDVCSECEREKSTDPSPTNQRDTVLTLGDKAPEGSNREDNLNVVAQNRDPTFRSAWATYSSADLSMTHRSPSQIIRKQWSHGIIDDRFVQKMSRCDQDPPQSQMDGEDQEPQYASAPQEATTFRSLRSDVHNNPSVSSPITIYERAVENKDLPRRHSSDTQRMDWNRTEAAVEETSNPNPHSVQGPCYVSLHPLQPEGEGAQDIGFNTTTSTPLDELTEAQSIKPFGSAPRVNSNIQPPPPAHYRSQPLTFVRPSFPKARSKSQPHLLSSFSDPEIIAQSTNNATLKLEGRCSHVNSLQSRARQTHATRPFMSRENSYFQECSRPGHISRQPGMNATLHQPLEPVSLVMKEPRKLPMILRYRSELIAQQLCLIERELLNQIQWYELVDAGWAKKPASTDQPKVSTAAETEASDKETVTSEVTRRTVRRDESQGIKKLVARFNLSCQWVASEIVKTRDLDMRVKVVEKFIRIAHTCYNHSNFSSLIQLMLGLQAPSVSRLNQTWDRVRAQEMRVMRDLVEFTLPLRNWKHLRDAMKNIADEWGGSGSEATPSSPPATEKPSSGSGVAFFSRRSSKSMAGAFASMTPSRRPSASQPSDSNTAATSTLPSSFFSNLQTSGKTPSVPFSPSTTSTSAKSKDKEKSGRQGGCIPFLGLEPAEQTRQSYLCEERASDTTR